MALPPHGGRLGLDMHDGEAGGGCCESGFAFPEFRTLNCFARSLECVMEIWNQQLFFMPTYPYILLLCALRLRSQTHQQPTLLSATSTPVATTAECFSGAQVFVQASRGRIFVAPVVQTYINPTTSMSPPLFCNTSMYVCEYMRTSVAKSAYVSRGCLPAINTCLPLGPPTPLGTLRHDARPNMPTLVGAVPATSW